MNALRSHHRLELLLKAAGLARSTFYYQSRLAVQPTADEPVSERIQEIYAQHRGCYGYRRITAVLRQTGQTINHKVVQRLMNSLGLKSVIRRKKYRSYRGEVGRTAANLLDRQFEADAPNQRWVTDVTEFSVGQEKLYLSPVMDLYNGEIIAYETSTRPVFTMVSNMIKKALKRLSPSEAPMLHSDQGWQYRHDHYRRLLGERGLTQSMSRKGNCLDNAAMESFFGTLKAEFFHLGRFNDVGTLQDGIDEYIDYYNNQRIKLKLKGLSPVQYRTQAFG